jgi:hypothetical protein
MECDFFRSNLPSSAIKNRENHVKKMIEIANKKYSHDEDE